MHIESIGLGSISTKTDYGLTASATERDTGSKFLRITDIREGSIDWENVPYCQCSQKDRKKYELKQGDIVFARTGSVGNSCLIREAPPGAVFASYLIRIRPNRESVDPVYLSYFFQTPDYWQQIMGAAVGAIHLGLNATKLKQLQVPLPPLPEQQRIAALLARADRLRRLRRYALDLGDGYLQSVFLQMFGDPVTNPRGWEMPSIGSLAKVKTGGTPSRSNSAFYGGSIPWVKTTEVIGSVIHATEETITEEGLEASNCELFPPNTILVAMYGQGLTRGRSAKLGMPAATNQACAAILPSSGIETDYLWSYIKFSYHRLRDLGRGGNQPNLNLSMVRDFAVPLPPLLLQQQFARIVHQFERLRAQQREAQRQAEHLFQTLLHQAFQGEKTFSPAHRMWRHA